MDEDFVERAGNLAESEVLNGIARARFRTPPPPGFDGECDCGEQIDPRRVALGYYVCFLCQERKEKGRRN